MDWPLRKPFDATTTSNELLSNVQRQLAGSGHRELRTVRVTVDGRRVRLQGRVSSYYLKQVAQAAALSVKGVESIDNELIVAARARPAQALAG